MLKSAILTLTRIDTNDFSVHESIGPVMLRDTLGIVCCGASTLARN